MRRGWKIYAAHHRIEMPVKMASSECQPSSINQSSARNNNGGGGGGGGRFYGAYSWVSETALNWSSDTGRGTEEEGEELGLFRQVGRPGVGSLIWLEIQEKYWTRRLFGCQVGPCANTRLYF